jgi:copper chaperone CopZ
MSELKILVENMTCEGCISNIKKALNSIDACNLGFDLKSKLVFIKNNNIDEKLILKTLKRAGYSALIID